MKDLNREVPVGDTRAYTEEQYNDLMTEVSPHITFSLTAGDGAEAFVVKNAPDDYLVWFVGSTTKYVGDDAVFDQFYVTCVEAYYDPHAALSGMCLQMKIDTETLQEEAYEERTKANVLPGDE